MASLQYLDHFLQILVQERMFLNFLRNGTLGGIFDQTSSN